MRSSASVYCNTSEHCYKMPFGEMKTTIMRSKAVFCVGRKEESCECSGIGNESKRAYVRFLHSSTVSNLIEGYFIDNRKGPY